MCVVLEHQWAWDTHQFSSGLSSVLAGSGHCSQPFLENVRIADAFSLLSLYYFHRHSLTFPSRRLPMSS